MHFVASGLHFDSVYWVCMDYVLFCGQCASVICYACLGYVSLESVVMCVRLNFGYTCRDGKFPLSAFSVSC